MGARRTDREDQGKDAHSVSSAAMRKERYMSLIYKAQDIPSLDHEYLETTHPLWDTLKKETDHLLHDCFIGESHVIN